MNQIIGLWTYPRTISTAMERVMMERGDLKVLHEPFSYFYYEHEKKSAIAQEYKDPNHPVTYPEIKAHILKAAESAPVFFKDMCAHCYDNLIADDEFLNRLTNTFLIRDPAKTVASFYALNPDVKLDEIGVQQASEVVAKVEQLTGKTAVIIDADDLENAPDATVAGYCEAIGIPFIAEAMHWESGHKKEWDIWKKWHTDAAKSCGIQKNMETFEVTIDNSDHLKKFYDYHMPHYQKMYNNRIKLQTG